MGLLASFLLPLVFPFSFFWGNIYSFFPHQIPSNKRISIIASDNNIHPSPTLTPTSIPTLTLIPTLTPIPIQPSQNPTIAKAILKPSPFPTLVSSVVASNSIRDYLMVQINDFRKSKGLRSISTDSLTCNFADIRAKEISSSFDHNGFTDRINNKSLPYPSYKLIVENLARTGDYKNVVNLWIASPEHNKNLSADTLYGCTGNYGDYYTYEGLR